MRLLPLLVGVAVVAIAGCSSASVPSAAAGSAAPETVPAAAASAPTPPPTPPAATAAERPFETYRAPGNDAIGWLALYYALSGTAVDYQAVAARLDPSYQGTTDAFKRRDALTALKARLDPAIIAAKTAPYVQLPPFRMHRPAYDVEHSRYDLTPLIGPQHRLTLADGNARVALAANAGLRAYTPANEAEARRLEEAMSANPLQQVDVIIYGKVVAAQAMGGDPQLTLVPTRVVVVNALVDGTTPPLFRATTNR